MKYRLAQWVMFLGLALGTAQSGSAQSEEHYLRFNDFQDCGCNKTAGGAGSAPSGANNAGGNNAKCPTCPPESDVTGPDGPGPGIGDLAMPRWWVDEPYINLHVSDTPLFYRASSGQPVSFSFYYKQRYMTPELDQVPTLFEWEINNYRLHLSTTEQYVFGMRSYGGTNGMFHGMTNAAWMHNWMMDMIVWDAAWEAVYFNGGNPPHMESHALYSDSYEALVFNPDGGINYFTDNAGTGALGAGTQTNDPTSQVRLTSFPHSYPDLTNSGPRDANGIFWGSTTNGLKLVYPDGSEDVFGIGSFAGGTATYIDTTLHALLTQRIDPQGRVTRIGYQIFTNGFTGLYRVRYVVDSDGRTNTFVYTNTTSWTLQEIDDPFGRKAAFGYQGSNWLSSIIDAANITNSFAYTTQGYFPITTAPSGWLTNVITPYGTTAFYYYQLGETNGVDEFDERATYVREPEGAEQLYCFIHNATNLVEPWATSPTVAGQAFDDGTTGSGGQTLDQRDSFYWDRTQTPRLSISNDLPGGSFLPLEVAIANLSANDMQKGRMQHWLLSGYDGASLTAALSSARDPSPDAAGSIEGMRTWLAYTNATPCFALTTSPVAARARFLPDGSVNYTRYHYYSSGLVSSNEQTYSKPDGTAGVLTNYFHYTNGNVDLYNVSNSAGQSIGLAYNANHQVVAFTNAMGEVSTNGYDSGTGNFTNALFSSGRSVTLTYYPPPAGAPSATSAYLNTITAQPEGRTTTISDYAAALPRALTVSGAGMGAWSVTNTFDGLNRLTGTLFQDNTTISNIYTFLYRTARKDRLGNWTYYGYDSLEHLTSITNALTGITTLTWCSCGSLTGIIDPMTNALQLNYNNQELVTSVIFPDNSSYTNQYDLLGRLTNRMDGAGNSIRLTYNNQGSATAINNAHGQLLGVAYDAVDRPTTITNADGVVLTRAYDLLNRVTNNTWPDGSQEAFRYGSNGLVAYTNQDQEGTLFGRDGAGRVTAVTNNLQQTNGFTYNALDEILTLADGLGHTTTWQYDPFGRLTNRLNNLSAGVQTNGFDANGQLATRWMPATGITTYKWDALGNLTNITYPQRTNTYKYDADRRLTNMLDSIGADALTSGFSYTPAGELAGETGPWTSNTLSYTYNQGRRATLSLNSQIPTVNQTYDYDAAWRLQSLAALAGTFNYGYPSGPSPLPAQIQLPNGASVANAYDSLGRLTNTALLNPWGHVLDGYGYRDDLWGLRTNITRQLGLTTNSVTALYDGIGQIANWTARESSGTARQNEQLAYGYDAAHNLQYRTNGLLVQTFTVDTLNQLSNVTRTGAMTVTGATPAPATSITVNGLAGRTYGDFTFAVTNVTLNDPVSSFIIVGMNGAGVISSNHPFMTLPASVNFAYDGNGNLTNDGTRSFYYDAENELTNVAVLGSWQSVFVYDGLSRRRIERDYMWQSGAWVLTNETRYLYDGMQVVQERDTNNNPLVTYTRGLDLSQTLSGAGGIGGLLARTDANGSTFYHSDGVGNVTALMDGAGNVAARYEYDGYGKLIGKWGALASANKMRFSSMPFNDTAGLALYPFRAYEPNFQRWLNRDPIGELGGINLYRAMGNDPVNRVDPLGLLNADRYEEIEQLLMQQYQGTLYYAGPDGTPLRDYLDYGGAQTADGDILVFTAMYDGLAAAGDFAVDLLDSGIKAAGKCFAKEAPNAVAPKGQLVSKGVREFMNGEKELDDLSGDEIDAAMQGYKNAADMAHNAAERAYQEARIKALLGEGPPPGPLKQFLDNYGGGQ